MAFNYALFRTYLQTLKKCHTQRDCSNNNPQTCQYFQIDKEMEMSISDFINSLMKRSDVDLYVTESLSQEAL